MIIVSKYMGVIPMSGKQVFTFGGFKLCHRSIKKDKCDYLLDTQTGAILRAYPIGTARVVVIEDFASRIDTFKDFILHPSNYEVIEREPLVKKTINKASGVSEKSFNISMHYYSDNSCVIPSGG